MQGMTWLMKMTRQTDKDQSVAAGVPGQLWSSSANGETLDDLLDSKYNPQKGTT